MKRPNPSGHNRNWTAVEIHYQAFANSGSLTLWLDDAQKQSLTFIDNDSRTLTEVRLGAQSIETGTRGTLYFDDFESRRFSYIGTLTDPGVDDPTATNQAGWFARTYTYSTTIPHAVTNVTPETGSPDTYSYDANGNMTCRVEGGVTYSQAYNAENRISSIAKRTGDCTTGTIIESWSFAYDGDGVRVMTAHFSGTSGTPDSITSYYMGGQFEVKDGVTKKYYSIAGMMVAVDDGTGLQYLLTDHLGSTVAVTNSSGTLTSQQRYLPFGAPRTIPNSPILGTDFTYTGQRKLDDGMGGIMDYRARFYSPALGRFLQPDSIIPNPANPQSWNRFSYVENRPINFNDPTGHCRSDDHPDDCFSTSRNYSGSDFLDLSGYTTWERKILRKLYDEGGDDGKHGVDYILANDIHITVGEPHKCVSPTGASSGSTLTMTCTGDWQSLGGVAGWYEGDDLIVLNPNEKYELGVMPDDWGLATIIHEAWHIEQGYFRAFTKGGELEGFQVGMRVLAKLGGITVDQLSAENVTLYYSLSGWDYGQNVKVLNPEYWMGLRWLPPYRPPTPYPMR